MRDNKETTKSLRESYVESGFSSHAITSGAYNQFILKLQNILTIQ